MIKVKFVHAHKFKTPAMNIIANKWHGKMILIGSPVYHWKRWPHCNTDLLWPILEPELLQEIRNINANEYKPGVCRHMFEGSD